MPMVFDYVDKVGVCRKKCLSEDIDRVLGRWQYIRRGKCGLLGDAICTWLRLSSVAQEARTIGSSILMGELQSVRAIWRSVPMRIKSTSMASL
jgi:hypothetical protein